MNRFYVYLLIDPITLEPFYVGKGCGRRMYEHYRIRSQLKNPLLKNKLINLAHQQLKPLYEKVLINASEDQCFIKETELIEQYGRRIDKTGNLCNLALGGQGAASSWSSDRKHQQSDKLKGSRGALPIKSIPVTQYSLNGEFIDNYPSAKVASEQVQSANRSYITQCCKGKRVSSGGFLWAYKGDPIPTYTKKYYQAVEQLTIDGDLIASHQSLTHAQNASGVELHNISECCRGKSKTAGGFIWTYSQELVSNHIPHNSLL